MSRRNLFDDIHGDRAIVRGQKSKMAKSTAVVPWKDPQEDEWEDDFKSSKTSTTKYSKCAHSHPALKLPGTDKVIYGGACGSPVVNDADVYIGFDAYSMRFTQRAWPWKKGTEFIFEIRDQDAPANTVEFRKLVEWTKKQIDAGMKVHCGCIGGHGRTGTFLAALVSQYGEADPIQYVRDHYCSKAVESRKQVQFLVHEYGAKPHKGRYEGGHHGSSKTTYKGGSMGISASSRSSSNRISPLSGKNSIWEAPR